MSIFSFFSRPALAHLGDTPEQVKARYGEVVEEQAQTDMDRRMGVFASLYHYKDFNVLVAYIDGLARFQLFRKKTGAFPESEAKTLLAALAEGGEWKAVGQDRPGFRCWSLATESKGTLTANWVAEKSQLGIVSQPYLDAYDAAKKSLGA